MKRCRGGKFLTVADTEFQTPGAIKQNGSSRPDSKVSFWDIVMLFACSSRGTSWLVDAEGGGRIPME